MQVKHAVLPYVDRVEQILDHWIGGLLLSSQFVSLYDQLIEVVEGNPAVFLKVKLFTLRLVQNT